MSQLNRTPYFSHISGIKKGRVGDLFHSVTAICRLFYDCSYKHRHYLVERATYRAKDNDTVLALAFPLRKVK
ncbi:hypothetical protein CWB99_23875 [Pseudoalteromonas rubra]|uniref:Uncharacterized protein n=1 Tax=Pseudoalteromonas rubra TaxID=43658 RepID=A0A5S3WEH9_9GAMM|nr:hypothetical protein CWB99_23875 [Pseudoalteromonas rubra]